VRQHQQHSEELLREAAKILVDGVRLQILSDIEQKLLRASLPQGAVETAPQPVGFRSFDPSQGINLYDEMREYEIGLIRWALQQAHGKQVEAARLLGIRPTTLNNKIKQYHIAWKTNDECGMRNAE
jgi:DNA-binding NtrC family response regulator